MSAPATVKVMTGWCNGCHRERECSTRYELGARFLCDQCAARRTPFRAAGRPIEPSIPAGQLCGSAPAPAESIDETARRAIALGITVSPGDPEPFPCVIPGHNHTARLHWNRGTRHWQYRCEEPGKVFGLADVRASIGYCQPRWLSGVEAARWRERLDHDAGLLDPRPVPFTIPSGLSAGGLAVAEGWRLLVGLRDQRFGDSPFVFARKFVAAWCGVSEQQARDGVEEIKRHALLVAVPGQSGRAKLWRPGSDDVRAVAA